jgi:ribonuclease HI
LKEVTIWTDGSCIKGNYGGVGCLLIYGHHQKQYSEAFKDTTNNQMEILAVTKGLNMLKEKCNVTVYSDSQYVVKGITQWIKGWKNNNWMTTNKGTVKNKELWQELDELNSQHNVEYKWVKAHNGTPENELVDKLARSAAEELRDECIC